MRRNISKVCLVRSNNIENFKCLLRQYCLCHIPQPATWKVNSMIFGSFCYFQRVTITILYCLCLTAFLKTIIFILSTLTLSCHFLQYKTHLLSLLCRPMNLLSVSIISSANSSINISKIQSSILRCPSRPPLNVHNVAHIKWKKEELKTDPCLTSKIQQQQKLVITVDKTKILSSTQLHNLLHITLKIIFNGNFKECNWSKMLGKIYITFLVYWFDNPSCPRFRVYTCRQKCI